MMTLLLTLLCVRVFHSTLPPCKELASVADFYVNDAFGTAHRAHASTEGITRFCSKAVAGFLMEKEVCVIIVAIKICIHIYIVAQYIHCTYAA